jgi:hypothetical protein
LYPLAGSVSSGKDNFGLSSVLAEDTDFLGQDVERHIQQAAQYRIRYFVMVTNAAKARMAALGPDRVARRDFGVWTVFEMKGPIPPEAAPLAAKPALALTAFSAKLTRPSDYDFLRLAEEDFAYPADPPIAFRPNLRADRLPDAAMFSGLVVEEYRYGYIGAAFERIRQFSREKPTVLVESPDPLFRLLEQRLPELGRVSVVRRTPPDSDRWIGTTRRSSYRADSVRQTWQRVRAALSAMLPAEASGSPSTSCGVTSGPGVQEVRCGAGARGEPVPVAINTNFHPNWRAADGRPLFMLSPTLMYTAVQGPAELTFRRSGLDDAALVVSAMSFAAILVAMFLGRRRKA